MNLETASIAQHCKSLHLASIGAQFASLAEEASQQNHSHLRYLEALLQSEVEDRERRTTELRLKDAHLPHMNTLEEFDFQQTPHIPASRIRALAEGGYLERAEPVFLIGEPGTGKSHLANVRCFGLVQGIHHVLLHQSVRHAKREEGMHPLVFTMGGHIPVVLGGAEFSHIDGHEPVDMSELACLAKGKELTLEECPRLFAGRVLKSPRFLIVEEHANRFGHRGLARLDRID